MNSYIWDEITPEILLGHVTKDLSYADIGLMYGVSRNTVSGKVYRWKRQKMVPQHLPGTQRHTNGNPVTPRKPKDPITGASQPPRKVEPVGPHRTRQVLTGKTIRHDPPAEYQPYVPKKPVEATPKPTNPPVDIMHLKEGMCAVVVSGPGEDVAYCGCKALQHLRFRMCAHHAEYMIVNEQERRRNQLRAKALRLESR